MPLEICGISLTDEEYEIVVKEMAERVKDTGYMTAEPRLRELLEDMSFERAFDEITVSWSVKFVAMDLLQVLGRIRRTSNP